jgi:glycosyltransferase involved in cell wall biosynthesis
MKSKPFVTYVCNTFNRKHLLKNLLRSFVECNQYSGEFEWIITDYGSTDGTRVFLDEFCAMNSWCKRIFLSEEKILNELEQLGRSPSTQRKKSHVMFGHARNTARKAGKAIELNGLFVEIADDHQFIMKHDWITDAVNVLNDLEADGVVNISSIIYRALPSYKIAKHNNETYPVSKTKSGVEYFVAKHKHYDDYHIQPASSYVEIGDYMEVAKLDEDSSLLASWKAGDDVANHYVDYLKRTKAKAMTKVFLKIPYAYDFPNDDHKAYNVEHDNLIMKPQSMQRMIRSSKNFDAMISSEQLRYIIG